jgi:hypothetical protein
MSRMLALATLIGGLAFSLGCSSDTVTDPPDDPQTGTFVIRGSASAAPLALLASTSSSVRMVDPSLFKVGFYRLYLSSNVDCSAPTLVHDYETRADFDLVTGPTLFSATGVPTGSYSCLIMTLSDVLEFVPDSDVGPCVAGTTYHTDTYRAGESDWKDVSGAAITGSGTDASPVDNMVDVFFSTDPAAVIGRGYSANQVLTLGAPAVVPGTSTFYFDGSGAVTEEDGSCRIVPGTPPEFR